MHPAPEPLFRRQALAARAAVQSGHVLELSPRWTGWAYWLLVAVLGVAALYAAVGTVYEYASGPAVIRVHGRSDVTARYAGTVARIEAQPGQAVRSGAVLVRLYNAQEEAELERARHEFEVQLVRLLSDPADPDVRQKLVELRGQRELAEAAVEQRTIRAPHAGTVSDVRIRIGQRLEPGELLLSLVQSDAPCVVVAMLPGAYRPLLRVGMPLRLELDGYRYAYRELTLDSIGDEIIGPNELGRYLGPELADTIVAQGPSLLVQAQLPTNTFQARGERFRYYDGMRAHARIRVAPTSLLIALVPGLRAALESSGG